jgi:hypothetical protein
MQGGLRRDDLRLARLGGADDRGRAGDGGGVRAAQRRPPAGAGAGAAMTRLSVDVTFDERHGYTGTAPELRSAVRALSLNGLGPWITDPLHELRDLQFN